MIHWLMMIDSINSLKDRKGCPGRHMRLRGHPFLSDITVNAIWHVNQNCLDKLEAGQAVHVEIQRFDLEEYVAMEYDVTVGAR